MMGRSKAPQGPIVLPRTSETASRGASAVSYVRALQENDGQNEKENGDRKDSLKRPLDVEKESVGIEGVANEIFCTLKKTLPQLVSTDDLAMVTISSELIKCSLVEQAHFLIVFSFMD